MIEPDYILIKAMNLALSEDRLNHNDIQRLIEQHEIHSQLATGKDLARSRYWADKLIALEEKLRRRFQEEYDRVLKNPKKYSKSRPKTRKEITGG